MPAEERLSAVAKRRRLNSINYAVSSLPVPDDVFVSVPTPDEHRVAQTIDKLAVNVTQSCASSALGTPDSNSFLALADNGAVKFSYVREIEKLSDNSVKLRIPKDQKCVISGSYSLWLKVGNIELLGAKLRPSSRLWYIHTPETFEAPAISSITEIAEIEICSIDTGAPALPVTPVPPWTLPNVDEAFEGTFLVHGHSTSEEKSFQKRDKELDTSILLEISRKLKQAKSRQQAHQAPTILVCGREFPGAESVSSYILNSLMTIYFHERSEPVQRGVLLIDLDSEVPSFAPPGTMSLVLVRNYTFGPAFTHLGVFQQPGNDAPYEILSLQHGSRSHTALECEFRMAWLLKCLRWLRAGQYSNCPVVVKFYGWFRNTDVLRNSRSLGNFKPDHIVHLGLDSDVTKAEQEVVQSPDPLTMSYLPINASKNAPVNVQHELLLRSYFHNEGYFGGQLSWSHIPLELDTRRQIWLSYGSSPGSIFSIFSHDLHHFTSDIEDSLHGRIVSILLHMRQPTESNISPQNRDAIASLQEPTSVLSSVNVLLRSGRSLTDNYIDDKTMTDTGTSRERLADDFEDATPLAALKASEGVCLGIGIVAGFDQNQKKLCLITPVSWQIFEDCKGRDARIVLVTERIGDEGQYDTAWTQTELDATLTMRSHKRTAHRRQMKVRARTPV